MDYLLKTTCNFKFLINLVIMQNVGAEMISNTSSYLDNNNDYKLNIVWPKEK